MPSLVPQPTSVKDGGKPFLLGPDTTITHPDVVSGVARLLRQSLGRATGYDFPRGVAGESAPDDIELALDATLAPSAYVLRVAADGVRIAGGDPAGLFHGTQTLLQLCPPEIFRRTVSSGRSWPVEAAEIEDSPRFGWRGFLLDTSRHFFGLESILKMIDTLALHRMNVLHLHLTDDQGWRLEIKRYPRLTEVGSWRPRSMVQDGGEDIWRTGAYDEAPHGGFLTQDDAREIVAYAAERFITVLPEIDLPGHSQAAIAAYPELGNTTEQLGVRTEWGINSHVLNVSDATLDFYRGVLDEVLDIFPSTYIHVGGDEVPKDEWKASPDAQARMADLGLANEEELQSWVIRQLSDFLTSRGRRLIGWEEILQGGLPAAATVMSWTDEKAGIEATSTGHEVIMAPYDKAYMYHYQSDDTAAEPPGVLPAITLRTVFEYEPVPAALTAEQAKLVLGAQCQMWTEWVATPRQMHQMVFPRLCAFSEAVWTHERGDFEAFQRRMAVHAERLRVMDVTVFEPRPQG